MNIQTASTPYASHPHRAAPATPAAPPGWGQQAGGMTPGMAAIPMAAGGAVFLVIGGGVLFGSIVHIAASIIPIAPLTVLARILPGMGFGGIVFGLAFAGAAAAFFGVARGLYLGARERVRLQKEGVRGRAQLVSVRDTGVRINDQPFFDLDVMVDLGDRPAYPARFRQMVPFAQLGLLQPGASMEILADPRDPSKVIAA